MSLLETRPDCQYSLSELALYYQIGEDSAKVIVLLGELFKFDQEPLQSYHFAHFFYSEAIHGASLYQDRRVASMLNRSEAIEFLGMPEAEFDSLVSFYKLTEPRHKEWLENPQGYRFSQLVLLTAKTKHLAVTDPHGWRTKIERVTPWDYATHHRQGTVDYTGELLEAPVVEQSGVDRYFGHFHLQVVEPEPIAGGRWKQQERTQSFANMLLDPRFASLLMGASVGDTVSVVADRVVGRDGPDRAQESAMFYRCSSLRVEHNHKEATGEQIETPL